MKKSNTNDPCEELQTLKMGVGYAIQHVRNKSQGSDISIEEIPITDEFAVLVITQLLNDIQWLCS